MKSSDLSSQNGSKMSDLLALRHENLSPTSEVGSRSFMAPERRISSHLGTVHKQDHRGFTLIEVLLSISIIILLFGFAALGVSQVSKRLLVGPSDAYLENIFTTAARRARDGAQASDWGVYLPYDEITRNLEEVIVFKGSNYATRDSAFDHTFVFSDKTDFVSVDFSGAGPDRTDDREVVFDLYSGQTSLYGSVELEVFGVSRTIKVSQQGFITREL